MEFSTPLILKGLTAAGTVSLAAVGVVHREQIRNFSTEKNQPLKK